jgi:hypothetical protein
LDKRCDLSRESHGMHLVRVQLAAMVFFVVRVVGGGSVYRLCGCGHFPLSF